MPYYNAADRRAKFFARPLASGVLNLDGFSDEALVRACTPVRLRAIFPLAVAAQRADDPALADYLALTAPFVERLQLIAAAGELSATVEIVAGQGADDSLPPFLSLHIGGAVFQSTFGWPSSPRCTAICERRSNAILSYLPYS
ncbi:TPA: hypothetical protein NK775_001910 [Serratia marcescens]|nr:hypothetical protein [Serratia marcescens]